MIWLHLLTLLQVPGIYKLGLIRVLESGGKEDVHPMLSSVFMDAAMEAIDRMTDVCSF